MISIKIVSPGGCTVCSNDRVTECLLRALNTMVNNRNDMNEVEVWPNHTQYVKALRLTATDELVTPLNAILKHLNKGQAVKVSEEMKC